MACHDQSYAMPCDRYRRIQIEFRDTPASPPSAPGDAIMPGLLGERGERKMSKSLRCIALIVALMLVYGTATAKDYRWSCTYSEKVSPAGIETDAYLHLDFAFDDVTRKAMVFGTNGSDVDVHMGSLAISFNAEIRNWRGPNNCNFGCMRQHSQSSRSA
jgi:hypothetical protein